MDFSRKKWTTTLQHWIPTRPDPFKPSSALQESSRWPTCALRIQSTVCTTPGVDAAHQSENVWATVHLMVFFNRQRFFESFFQPKLKIEFDVPVRCGSNLKVPRTGTSSPLPTTLKQLKKRTRNGQANVLVPKVNQLQKHLTFSNPKNLSKMLYLKHLFENTKFQTPPS